MVSKRLFHGMVATGFCVLAIGYGVRASPEVFSYISQVSGIDYGAFERVVEYSDAFLAGLVNISGLEMNPQQIYDSIKAVVSGVGAASYGKKALSRD